MNCYYSHWGRYVFYCSIVSFFSFIISEDTIFYFLNGGNSIYGDRDRLNVPARDRNMDVHPWASASGCSSCWYPCIAVAGFSSVLAAVSPEMSIT